MFHSRGIRLYNNKTGSNSITENKTVIDFAIKYVERHNLKLQDLMDINFIRKKKQIYLPFELVGDQGRCQTESYIKIDSLSQIKWDFFQPIEESSTKKQK